MIVAQLQAGEMVVMLVSLGLLIGLARLLGEMARRCVVARKVGSA